MARTLLGKLGLAAAALVLTLAVLECGARLMVREGAAKTTRNRYMEYDPLLGWRKKAGAHVVFHEPEYSVEVRINSHGLRDPERGYDAPPGAERILVLGDSFVEGYSVPLEATVSQVLERSLVNEGCRVEVINGGTSGYSTDQEYLFYLKEGIRYSPKAVVLFFYYNDIVYNAMQSEAGTPKPILVLRDGDLKVHRYPVEPPRPNETRPERSPEPHLRSALLEWIRDRLWYGAPRAFDVFARLGLWGPRRREGPPLELRVYERADNPRVEAGWKETGLILESLSRHVAQEQAHLLIAYVPSRMEVDERSWEMSRTTYPLKGDWDRGLVYERLRRLADAAGLTVLDLGPALKRAGATYLSRDGHWNALGHRTAADEVRRFLLSARWVQGCP